MGGRELERARAVKREARRIGFDKAGIARAKEPEDGFRLREWLAAGMHGRMEYMARDPDSRSDVRKKHPWARSVICAARSYYDPGKAGTVSFYARGRDYHDRMGEDLERLGGFLEREYGARWRRAVDTSPVLERPYAREAGLGWIGKNTMLIAKDLGSWFFLGEVVTDADLEADRPYVRNYCGTCSRCVDLCPTAAIVGPYRLDARRCISYLTIEHRGVIDRELRPLMGRWVFGCDVCQEVCPWNRFAKLTTSEDFKPRGDWGEEELAGWMGMSDEEFRRRFKGSPILRAKRDGFLRNVAVALGNSGSPQAVLPLERGLNDSSWLVRLHAAWGLGRIGTAEAFEALRRRGAIEEDERVREEIGEWLRPLA